MLKKIKSKEFWHRMILPISLIVIALTAGFGIYQYRAAHRLRNAVENSYERAFAELSGDIEDLGVCLAKAMVIQDTEEMVRLSAEIYRMADGAKVNLACLPTYDTNVENMEKFLSQVGNYCYAVSLSHLEGTPVSSKEIEQIKTFYEYAKVLENSVAEVQASMQRGEMNLWDQGKSFGELPTIAQGFTTVEEEFQEYPSLIYDGPFSEHIEKKESTVLKDLEEIDANQAQNILKKALGSRGNVLSAAGEENGKIPAYNFVGEVSEGRQISAQITKKGGKLLWFLDHRQPFETKISMEDAFQNAKEFLKGQGYENVKESYYEVKGNVAIINFAAVQGGVVLYPDLLKVRVAMDDGEILGMEAKGYLMNHQERSFPVQLIGEQEAAKKISPQATAEECSLALIPLESGSESLCYEWKVTMEDRVFLVYVNATSGKIDDLLLLLETPQGVLTV